jgi:hypothetical protein
MKKLITIISIILLSVCCEEDIKWDLKTQKSNIIVVEGMITNERTQHQVRLTRPVQRLNETPEPVSGATVTISDQNSTFILDEYPEGSGLYLTDSIRGVFGRLYILEIKTVDKEYSAEATMVAVTPFDTLEYSLASASGNLFQLIHRNNSDEPSMTEYYLDWSDVPGFKDADPCRAKIVYYSLNTIDAGEMFRPESEQVLFPAGTIVSRRKYSMNEAQAAFIRTLLSETEWRGGLFDIQPGNVQTNLSEGAVGYFSASTVITDSTIISP